MSVVERSPGASVFALAALALVALSLAQPWFTAEHSSGRRTPAEGLQPADETGVNRQELADKPFGRQGDAQPQEPAAHDAWLQRIGWLAVAGAGLLALVVLAEVPGIRRVLVRRASLALGALAVLCLAAATLAAWFALPATMGIGGSPFASRLGEDDYWRTSLGLGWAAAALAVPVGVAALACKFQAGSEDATAIEAFRRPS